MLRLLWLCLPVVFAGCATGLSPTKSAADGGDERLAELSRIQTDQARRIAELEARLNLVESDARRARAPNLKPSATVRIGEHAAPSETSGSFELAEPSAAPNPAHGGDRRPNLKLQGRTHAARDESSSQQLPALPVTNETLPVVPLPQERSRAQQADRAPAAVSESATQAYRAALRVLRERRFAEAGLALSNWVSDNPEHALLDRAMYWLAEVRYATRDYRQALAEFEKVLERFPSSEKAPDTLYKLGMCWRRLGSEDQARAYFRRLRTQFPTSEAADLASREGST